MLGSYLVLMKELIITELMILRKQLKDKIINQIIITVSVNLFTAYIYTYLGMPVSFAAMTSIGLLISCGVFEIFSNTATFLSDIDGERIITYELTLPVPGGWFVLVKKALIFGTNGIVLAALSLPLGKLVLQDQLDLSAIHLGPFILAIVCSHLLCGFFCLLLTAYTRNMGVIGNVWSRMIMPLWFFGGSQFNWSTLYEISPTLAYINLANPFTYAYEALKAASLEGDFLPFWGCIAVLSITSLVCLYIANRKLKQRLDYL